MRFFEDLTARRQHSAGRLGGQPIGQLIAVKANGSEVPSERGVVRLPRRVFHRLLPERPTPERCVEPYYVQRTRFERSPSGSWPACGRGREPGASNIPPPPPPPPTAVLVVVGRM